MASLFQTNCMCLRKEHHIGCIAIIIVIIIIFINVATPSTPNEIAAMHPKTAMLQADDGLWLRV